MMNATGRVNRPSPNSTAPHISIMPANQYIVSTGGVANGDGQPNSRDRPCSRNNSATAMRTMLRT